VFAINDVQQSIVVSDISKAVVGGWALIEPCADVGVIGEKCTINSIDSLTRTLVVTRGDSASWGSTPLMQTKGKAWPAYTNVTFGNGFASGDPHVMNIRGEQFDIKRVGVHKLIQIPRIAPSTDDVEVRVDVDVQPRHDVCGELYIQRVHVSGNKLEDSKMLNFSLGTGLLGSELLLNGMPVVEANISGLEATSSGQSLKLRVGGTMSQISTARAGCCYHYINYKVSLSKTELSNQDIGGLLGKDAHLEAATKPWQCRTGSVEFAARTDEPRNPSMQSLITAVEAPDSSCTEEDTWSN